MNALLRNTFSVAAFALATAVTTGHAAAQAVKVVAEKPTNDDLPSPQFQGGKDKSFKPKDWLEVETKLKVQLAPAPASKTLDKLTVKWYIAVKNPDKPGTFFLLTKDVDHVNVPLDEDIYVSAYLSPASIKRITGSDKGGKQALEYVGFEILVNGEKAAAETDKGKVGWWATASEKISRSDTVPLLSKAETPFRDMWWDRYAEVAVEKR